MTAMSDARDDLFNAVHMALTASQKHEQQRGLLQSLAIIWNLLPEEWQTRFLRKYHPDYKLVHFEKVWKNLPQEVNDAAVYWPYITRYSEGGSMHGFCLSISKLIKLRRQPTAKQQNVMVSMLADYKRHQDAMGDAEEVEVVE